jgi:hypothetical protein
MATGSFIIGKVTGVNELGIKLRGLEKAWLSEMEAAIPTEAHALMASANALVPVASGTLKASALVTSQVVDGRKVEAVACYTDKKAAAVHEGIHWGIHFQGEPGFKWYERALSGFAQGFVDRMLARCLAVLERAGDAKP